MFACSKPTNCALAYYCVRWEAWTLLRFFLCVIQRDDSMRCRGGGYRTVVAANGKEGSSNDLTTITFEMMKDVPKRGEMAPLLDRRSKLDCSTTKGVRKEPDNHTESPRRDGPTPPLLVFAHSWLWSCRPLKIALGGVPSRRLLRSPGFRETSPN